MSKEDQPLNLNGVTLNDLIKYIDNNSKLQLLSVKNNITSPKLFIQGKPGIGKSDIVRSFCESRGYGLVVKYMSNMLYEMMTGLPIADTLKVDQEAQWSKPNLFSFTNFAYKPNEKPFDINKTPIVLLIDDVHLCDKNTQKFLFQLLTYRSINDYTLPDNVIIILAGNRIIDKAGAHPIPAPICNRLIFVDVVCSSDDWIKNFAIKHNIRHDIVTYIKQYGNSVLIGEPVESMPWPSPRSWTFLSQSLDCFDNLTLDDVRVISNGLIGIESTNKFIMYCKLFSRWNFDKLIKQELSTVFKQFDNAFEKDQNPIIIYSIINAATSYMINQFKNDNNRLTDHVKQVIRFVYKVYIHFLDDKFTNYKPFIVTGINYIIDIHNQLGLSDILDYFIDQIESDNDVKNDSMYQLLMDTFSVD